MSDCPFGDTNQNCCALQYEAWTNYHLFFTKMFFDGIQSFFYPRWVAIPCCSYAPTLLECWHITLARLPRGRPSWRPGSASRPDWPHRRRTSNRRGCFYRCCLDMWLWRWKRTLPENLPILSFIKSTFSATKMSGIQSYEIDWAKENLDIFPHWNFLLQSSIQFITILPICSIYIYVCLFIYFAF